MKKIIILTSEGGGGQVTINAALTNQLKSHYDLKSVLYFVEILHCVDLFYFFSFGYYSGEDFYNYVQKKRFFRFMQACYYVSRWYYYFFSYFLIKRTTHYLAKEKPDLVISIIPIVNNILAKSCAALNIPFLIIPPDLDVAFFTQDMRAPYADNLYLALPFDNPLSRTTIVSIDIPEKHIFSIPYPLRNDFFLEKDRSIIKKQYAILDDNPVILLMMGAQGNSGSYTFTQELIKIHNPCHLIICIGHNIDIQKKLENIAFPPHITAHIIGYTDQIAYLMAIADIMIGKTGVVSVVEALYSDTPIIADQTDFVLSWELYNQHFLTHYQCGFILKKLDTLAPLVDQLLTEKNILEGMKKRIAQLVDRNKQGTSMQEIIEQILRTS